MVHIFNKKNQDCVMYLCERIHSKYDATINVTRSVCITHLCRRHRIVSNVKYSIIQSAAKYIQGLFKAKHIIYSGKVGPNFYP
jgi:hypothetical protein